ncbi:hypothetical protein GGR57DRAFT_493641 [Xylariaceae sp. FL1272]|nr:hypothetical protein GGR57DRAFT_493641 [Xylariaceae sp. FL1272]
MQGSLSYTVTAQTILSFRIHEGKLDGDVEKLAVKIHGDIVPKATLMATLGDQTDKSKSLLVYAMPLLPGKSGLETLAFGPTLEDENIAKHINFTTHLARYFAGNWLNPQKVTPDQLEKSREDIERKLAILQKDERFEYLRDAIDEIRGPQALRRCSGNMNAGGWSDYTCRVTTEGAFWSEFWKVTGVEDPEVRNEIKRNTETACKLGLILRFAFTKTLDGKPLDILSPRPSRYLYEWLKNSSWSDLVLRESDRPLVQKETQDEARKPGSP